MRDSPNGVATLPGKAHTPSGRRVLHGAMWSYGAQAATVMVQFGYAAVTSRAVSPEGFGAYATALAVSGLITLLASGGVGQTLARLSDVEPLKVHALASYSLCVGLIGGAALFFGAPLWASLWGVPGAVWPLRLLAVSSSLSPFYGLVNGLMARLGKFRPLAWITFTANLIGFLIGASAVMVWREPVALVVSPIVSQVLLLAGCLSTLDKTLLGLASIRHARADLRYSGSVVATSLFSYFTGNIVKLSMPRALSSSSLGHWNRAEAITLVPLQQIQNAMISAVFPEFRHDLNGTTRAKQVWTDMLIIVGWVAFCIGAGGAVVIPVLLPVVFGPGWSVASTLAGPLAIAGGLQVVSTLLASAIGALGRFRWLWSTEALLIALQIAAVALLVNVHRIEVAAMALIATQIVRHAWQVWLAARRGYLDWRRLVAGYSLAGLWALNLALVLKLDTYLFLEARLTLLGCAMALLITALVGASTILVRKHLPPFVIARRYGLVR